tara:strand:+ start:1051 stop:1752 length:702 start_codon:yes stop_codon:yes gene_type:complete
MSFKQYFNDFIDILNTHKVRYVVLRGYVDLPETFSNDLDFGIHPLDKNCFFVALKEYKTLHNIKIKVNLSRYEVLKLQFSYSNQKIDFDFWFDINFCGLKYINLSDVIDNTLDYKTFKIPNAENELTISFLKELLHMKRLREDKVLWLNNKIVESDLASFAIFFPLKFRHTFVNVIRNHKFNLEKLSRKSKVELFKFHIRQSGIRKIFKNIMLFFYFRIRNNKNPLVLKTGKI